MEEDVSAEIEVLLPERINYEVTLPEQIHVPENKSYPVVTEPTLLDIEEDFLDEDEEEADHPEDLLKLIQNRCDEAGIVYDLSKDPSHTWIKVNIPAGRDTRQIFIASSAAATKLLAQPFEKISFIRDFDAICRFDQHYIVALLGSLGPGVGLMRFRRLFGINSYRDLQNPNKTVIEITPPADHPNVRVTLSLDSDEIATFVSRMGGASRPILTIRNVEFATNDRAAEILETIANSLLFEIDLRLGIPLGLVRYRAMVGSGSFRSLGVQELSENPLQFPQPHMIAERFLSIGMVGVQ